MSEPSSYVVAGAPSRRFKMRLALTPFAVAPSGPFRSVECSDAPALGTLMYAAYKGTIDDEGETEADAQHEVGATLSGQYGPLLGDCSFLIEDQPGGRALCATLVTQWRDGPLLAFVMTRPDAKRQGMATCLIQRSANALLARGERELYLAVTEGNIPALRVYERLGFRVEP
jgi:GNAT superfamily N-acetyltransferase